MAAHHEKMTQERIDAVREFAEIYGDRWQEVMVEFHMGRPSSDGMHILHFIRQIRNYVTPDPAQLERYVVRSEEGSGQHGRYPGCTKGGA